MQLHDLVEQNLCVLSQAFPQVVNDHEAFLFYLNGPQAKFDGEFTILCHRDKTLVVLFSEVLQLLD